jgi:hypothetical protein
MDERDQSATSAMVVTGFGVRSPMGRCIGVALFVLLHVGVLAWLLAVDLRLNRRWLEGYPFAVVILHLGLTVVWFYLSHSSTFTRWAVILLVLSLDAGLVRFYASHEHGLLDLGLLVSSTGLWIVPLATAMGVVRQFGLRVVTVGQAIVRDPLRSGDWSSSIAAGAVAYGASLAVFLGWVDEQLDWELLIRLLSLQFVFAASAGLTILGIPAALAHRHAPRWFGGFVAAVFALALLIVVNHALKGDLNWKRFYRDAAAALLGFVPYLHLLWFRVLGYRVAIVGH